MRERRGKKKCPFAFPGSTLGGGRDISERGGGVTCPTCTSWRRENRPSTANGAALLGCRGGRRGGSAMSENGKGVFHPNVVSLEVTMNSSSVLAD